MNAFDVTAFHSSYNSAFLKCLIAIGTIHHKQIHFHSGEMIIQHVFSNSYFPKLLPNQKRNEQTDQTPTFFSSFQTILNKRFFFFPSFQMTIPIRNLLRQPDFIKRTNQYPVEFHSNTKKNLNN